MSKKWTPLQKFAVSLAGLVFAAVVALVVSSKLRIIGPPNKSEPDPVRAAEMNEIKFQRVARELVQANLRDPSSAQFRNQREFCGEVNSKNAFGGMAGFQRFIAADKDMVILERDSGLSRADFQKIWGQACK